MNVNYEHKPAMTFIGFSTSIRPEEGYRKCPEFWDREYTQKYARLWQTMQPETAVEAAILENGIGMFAICDEKDGSFEYWIAGLYRGGDVPEGLKLHAFPESEWAVFCAKGPLPGSLQALNTQVWQEWYPNEGQNTGRTAAPCWRSTPPVICAAPITNAASGSRFAGPEGKARPTQPKSFRP